MTEPMDRNGSDRNVIDGSAVIAREIARLFVPASKYPDGLSPCRGIDKCLLEDGREVYQCASEEAEPQCNWWHDRGESVRAHLRSHTEKTSFKIAQLRAERDELIAREEQRRNNYREGALKGAANRKLRNALRQNEDSNDIASENEEAVTVSVSDKDRQKKIDNAHTSLEGVADGLAKVRVVIDNMTKTIDNVAVTLDELAIEVPAADPVLVAKAASWDAMQALLNPKS